MTDKQTLISEIPNIRKLEPHDYTRIHESELMEIADSLYNLMLVVKRPNKPGASDVLTKAADTLGIVSDKLARINERQS